MRRIVLAAAILLAAGCAYREPTAAPVPIVAPLSGDRPALFAATLAELTASGFTPAAMDRESGLIATQPKRLPPSEAGAAVDLGTMMGGDPTADRRTTTNFALTVQVDSGQITMTAAVTGDYLPGDAGFGQHMVGVSRGTIERALAGRISARLSR